MRKNAAREKRHGKGKHWQMIANGGDMNKGGDGRVYELKYQNITNCTRVRRIFY